MRILITGGMGFIGKHLVNYLIKKENTVTIFDNFSNSKREIDYFSKNKKIEIMEGDITELDNILNATKNIDVVIHLAAKISVNESIKNPSKTFHINVDGTKNVLKACEKNNVHKLIIASSAAIYGESISKNKINEKSSKNPISPYGESKLMMENEIMKILSNNKNMDCVILRFFNIYGIGQTIEYAGVITKFLENILKNKPIEIFGDGLQTRDFVAVDDVVESINNAIANGSRGIFNIASGNSITINELAKLMVLWSKKEIEIHHLDPRNGDIKYSAADITLAKNELKYSPKHKIEKIKDFL